MDNVKWGKLLRWFNDPRFVHFAVAYDYRDEPTHDNEFIVTVESITPERINLRRGRNDILIYASDEVVTMEHIIFIPNLHERLGSSLSYNYYDHTKCKIERGMAFRSYKIATGPTRPEI